jgi:hypothetical protein
MKDVRRIAVLAALVVVVVLAGLVHGTGRVTAHRAMSAIPPTGHGKVTYQRPDGVRPRGVRPATLGSISEAGGTFHGLTPCRIVDTRRTTAGPIAANTSRDFFGIGPLTDQGASLDDCGLPVTATAFVLNITATSPRGRGELRVWPFGGPVPLASLVSFRTGTSIANAATVAICRDPAFGLCPEFDFTVRSSNAATDVAIDVMGYFEGPMSVKVNADGTPFATSFSVDSVSWLATGTYEVTFDRDITECTTVATIDGHDGELVLGGQVTVTPSSANANAVQIATFDYSGAWVGLPFSLVVSC